MIPQEFRNEENINNLAKQISDILNNNSLVSTTFNSWKDRIFITKTDLVNTNVKVYLRIGQDISDSESKYIINRINMANVLEECHLRLCVYFDADDFIKENEVDEREVARKMIKEEILGMQKEASNNEPQFIRPVRQGGTPFCFDPATTEEEFEKCFNAVMKKDSGRKVSRFDFFGKAKRAGAKVMQKILTGNFSTKNQGRNTKKIIAKYQRIFNRLCSESVRRQKHRERKERREITARLKKQKRQPRR